MKKLLPILVVVMFVVACGTGFFVYGAYKDYRGESSSVVSNSVVEVSDDTSFYSSMDDYNRVLLYFIETTYPDIMNKNINSDNQEYILFTINEFIVYSETFDTTPITDTDRLLYGHFKDLQFDAESLAEYMLDYIHKGQDSYLKFAKNSFQNVQIHLETMSTIEKQYYK